MNAFIATQGPLDHTVEDFWRMVWENNSRLILMMCELTENKRSKCAEYFPRAPQNNKISNDKEYSLSNGLSVKVLSESKITGKSLTIRTFNLKNNLTKNEREITQLHFRNWPDHGVPDINNSYDVFQDINLKLDNHFEQYKGNSPVIVHCSAGVGRTGTIITIFHIYYILKKQFERNQNNKILTLNIFSIVRKLKEQRRFLVEKASQYYLIYSFLDIFVKNYFIKIKGK